MTRFLLHYDQQSPRDNDAPEGLREITQEQYCRAAWSAPLAYEFRQVMLPAANGKSYWTGLRMLTVIIDGEYQEGTATTETFPLRYFAYGCDHKWREPDAEDFARGVPRPRMCFHVGVCSVCGRHRAVDSSD